MIPEQKSAAVTRGLQEAFGVTEFEDIRTMTKGHTPSLVFRIVVRGSPYLLKIIMLKYDPTRHFTCMKAAAEAGLAPHVWYSSVEDRIFISDFVEAVPFRATDALVRIPATLRALHALPPFPNVANQINTSCMFLMNEGTGRDEFLRRFEAANILTKNETDELFAWHAQLCAAYPRHDPDMVSSHNDLFKPDNILFDGHRVWLVDWEAAFRNDRYADLAVVANLVVTSEAEETVYLQEYFGHPPDKYQLARFFLMQQIVHMFYGMVYLFLGSAGKAVYENESVPEFRELQRRMWAGEVDLADSETKLLYGRLHWRQLLQNMQMPRYKEALRIVSERHPRT